MSRWRQIQECVPWLRTSRPYFVHTAEESRLRKDLHVAGFTVVRIDGASLHDENDLLKSLGLAFDFPDYYGANWDAFSDCMGDIANQGDAIVLVWSAADIFMRRDLHGFVRAIHLLLSAAEDLGSSNDPFQFEIFLIGSQEDFRNTK